MSIVGHVRVLGFGLFVAKETVLIMLEEQRALAKGIGNEEEKNKNKLTILKIRHVAF